MVKAVLGSQRSVQTGSDVFSLFLSSRDGLQYNFYVILRVMARKIGSSTDS